ncbi:MAG: type IV pilin protein [Lachnospiraceae bacterium]|jgi:prepilin-type N-terminal cleavage/methylation domain-containing protein
MKKMNKKGFTLMELLIVVAIIAVLVAISIPIFNNQFEKAREATDAANIRAEIANVTIHWMENSTETSKTVTVTQKSANWKINGDASTMNIGGIDVAAKTSGEYTIAITADGVVSVD